MRHRELIAEVGRMRREIDGLQTEVDRLHREVDALKPKPTKTTATKKV